jgi:protein-tyrosine phosphatase
VDQRFKNLKQDVNWFLGSVRQHGLMVKVMIDLHCHILPGLDDGPSTLAASVQMASAFVADGVSVVACTPHILPGLYKNSGPHIRRATANLQRCINEKGIPLRLVTGADNHVTPEFLTELRRGHLLSLADSRYVLVEPPHHVTPPRLKELLFELIVGGYVPVLTHPERLTWINSHYESVRQLVQAGVWLQLTAGSLAGAFGKNARYWSDRMLDDGVVHILATDAHDVSRRPPNLSAGRDLAARRIGEREAENLVVTRPEGVLRNAVPSSLPSPAQAIARKKAEADELETADLLAEGAGSSGRDDHRGVNRWLRRFRNE